MHEEYASFGMQVVVFPSDQFLGMEHNKPEEIIEYARKKMGATFPLMEKCLVNGEQAHPIFKCLRKQTPCFYNSETGKIKNIPFNFSKFILD